MAATPAPTTNDLAIERTVLARERTEMAAERTLMAWCRTGVSQIGLGISLFKFLEAMKVTHGARLASVIIGLGTVATLLGMIDYVALNRRMNKVHGPSSRMSRVHFGMASAVLLFGCSMWIALLARRL